MPLPEVSKQEIKTALLNVGLTKGDIAYVASFTPILGGRESLLDDILTALYETLTPDGTLIMPAFNWDYCKGSPFDPLTTPSQVGILSEKFRNSPQVLRNESPPWNTFCACGKRAKEIAAINARTPFGSDSVLQFLYDNNAKYVLLGLSCFDGTVQIHWLEEKHQVPYRYWKKFNGFIKKGTELIPNESMMYARNLDFKAEIDATQITTIFEQSPQVKTVKIGLGKLMCFTARDYVSFVEPYIIKDPLVLLTADARKRYDSLVSKKT